MSHGPGLAFGFLVTFSADQPSKKAWISVQGNPQAQNAWTRKRLSMKRPKMNAQTFFVGVVLFVPFLSVSCIGVVDHYGYDSVTPPPPVAVLTEYHHHGNGYYRYHDDRYYHAYPKSRSWSDPHRARHEKEDRYKGRREERHDKTDRGSNQGKGWNSRGNRWNLRD